MMRAYLDNNATTRPYAEVVDAVRDSMLNDFLNLSSAAAAVMLGDRDPISDARKAIALLLGADAEGVMFTSGASEANSWVTAGLRADAHVVTSAIEHPSLELALQAAERRGVRVSRIMPEADGQVAIEDVMIAVTPETALVTVMLANNETGVIQPVGAIADAVREVAPGVLMHTDATQAVGRLHIDLEAELSQVDLLSLSAHKFHGPKGIGALFVRPGIRLGALVHGEQEDGRRGGTYNAPGLAGFAMAAMIARRRLPEWKAAAARRDRMEASLLRLMPDAFINGALAERLPNTISLTVPGIDAQQLVDRLAAAGICAATGSACSSGAPAPSPSLLAMGMSHSLAEATIRFSLSLDTSDAEIDLVLTEVATVSQPVAP